MAFDAVPPTWFQSRVRPIQRLSAHPRLVEVIEVETDRDFAFRGSVRACSAEQAAGRPSGRSGFGGETPSGRIGIQPGEPGQLPRRLGFEADQLDVIPIPRFIWLLRKTLEGSNSPKVPGGGMFTSRPEPSNPEGIGFELARSSGRTSTRPSLQDASLKFRSTGSSALAGVAANPIVRTTPRQSAIVCVGDIDMQTVGPVQVGRPDPDRPGSSALGRSAIHTQTLSGLGRFRDSDGIAGSTHCPHSGQVHKGRWASEGREEDACHRCNDHEQACHQG